MGDKKNLSVIKVIIIILIVIFSVIAGIVIFMIASISLSERLGESGLEKKAESEFGDTKEVSQDNSNVDTDNNIINNTTNNDEIPEQNSNKSTDSIISNNIGNIISTTKNTILLDDNNNRIILPAGFAISKDSATKVEGGIVIEDKDGNQFVWIPADTVVFTKAETHTMGLHRFTFEKGGKLNYADDELVNNLYKEAEQKQNNNSIAKNIADFKNSVDDAGGFYIGRYEAKCDEARSDSDNNLSNIKENKSGCVYNYISQTDASSLCQNMYNCTCFTSDLANSYAWDTTLLYTEYYGNKEYSQQGSINKEFSKNGTLNLDNKDSICNIYDMASNCAEWTTETSTSNNANAVIRGGLYTSPNVKSSDRNSLNENTKNIAISFRPIIYMHK